MKQPEYLKEGDKIAIVGLAKKVDKADIDWATKIFKSWGLETIIAKHLYHDHFRYSATDDLRLLDLQEALDDPEIKAVIAARGGYGSARIIDLVNWKTFLEKPKWIIGFSDITVFLGQAFNMDVMSIHGIMPAFYQQKEASVSINALRELLFGHKEIISSPYHLYNIPGEVHAPVIGGNLSILCSMIGTSSDFDYEGKILFLEEVDEYLYRVDRMMVQLKRTGKLDTIKGAIIGQFSTMKDNEGDPFGKDISELLADYLKPLGVPVAFDFPAGHEPVNYPLIIGENYTLKVSDNGVLLFR